MRIRDLPRIALRADLVHHSEVIQPGVGANIFTRDGMEEILNLQPAGSKAKPYQVKQIRNILVKYRLGEADVD